MKRLNENIPTGRLMPLPEGAIGHSYRHPLHGWRAVEDAVLALEPGSAREQLIDVLATNYAYVLKGDDREETDLPDNE